MTTLICSDIHFTEQARDAYRWGLFPWMLERVRQYGVDQMIILGDCTDRKDRHGSALVKQFCSALVELAKVCSVYIIAGNHDFIDPLVPFFSFVSNFPGVSFFVEPAEVVLVIASEPVYCLFLPSTLNPEVEWAGFDFSKYRYIFMHQTVVGSLRENGTRSDVGLRASFFRDNGFTGDVISGDIHVPQVIAGVLYVGAPYRIDFGDTFNPRVLLIDGAGQGTSLHFPCPDKHLVDITSGGEIVVDGQPPARGGGATFGLIMPGDQVKVRVTLQRSDIPMWPKLQKDIKSMAVKGEWVLFGPELRRAEAVQATQAAPVVPQLKRAAPLDLLNAYGAKHAIDKSILDVGAAILEGTG